MTNPTKQAGIQAYHVVVFDRALHPELFGLRGRRVREFREFEVESWVMDGAHLIRFEHRGTCISELVADHETGVPRHGIVSTIPCASEAEYEHSFPGAGCAYMISVQTESLSDNLYLAACEEYGEFARESGALVARWSDEGGPCLSIVDVQHQHRQVHVQGYHLVAAGGLVLRTQSIFELR